MENASADESFSFSEEKISYAFKILSEPDEGEDIHVSSISAIKASSAHLLAECINVTVKAGKVCINIPGYGKKCIKVGNVGDGTLAEACIHICKKYGAPVGAEVYIKIAGERVASWGYGYC